MCEVSGAHHPPPHPYLLTPLCLPLCFKPLPSCVSPLSFSPTSLSLLPRNRSKFVTQLARLCKPGGTVILADFCRKPGPMTKALTKRFKRMDKIFATAGNWKSAEDFKDMMGELVGRRL